MRGDSDMNKMSTTHEFILDLSICDENSNHSDSEIDDSDRDITWRWEAEGLVKEEEDRDIVYKPDKSCEKYVVELCIPRCFELHCTLVACT